MAAAQRSGRALEDRSGFLQEVAIVRDALSSGRISVEEIGKRVVVYEGAVAHGTLGGWAGLQDVGACGVEERERRRRVERAVTNAALLSSGEVSSWPESNHSTQTRRGEASS
eukprot:CAMPEP_0171136518 /NCGR_PEP_ID=MMETSP0766_2-20121228/131662_1 /TAXON_ID=439317 /ORGANISM="Gambierdiscus australes, Strain CAWD 149" /LENGTH=111 /DNA_ID=CAMNT_0011600059 /DNA_START=1 /DNA_END=333 /DNA_ORIENTATION=-